VAYLVDTNAISELVRPSPAPRVQRWFHEAPPELLYLSVLTLGELRKGVEALGDDPRRERLRIWLEQDLVAWFAGRIVPVDTAIAERWGRLLAEVGRPVAAVDSLLAATALHHELRIVTRNVKDFDLPGVQTVNPWD